MDLKIFENGTYTQDDILEWHETFGTKEYQKSLKNLQEDQFDNIFKHQDENSIYTIGEKNGVTVILNTEPIPTLFGTNMDDLAAAGESTKKKIFDVAAATPGFLKDAFNPVNIGKGLNTAVVNFFDFIDNSTGGAVTTLDNFFVENFPNTLGKKFEYEEPQTPGGVTGKIIGQYVMTDLFLRRVIPFFRKNTATGIAADATTVGLFSSKDEGNIASTIGEMFPNFTNNNVIAKTIIEGLTADEDDSEVEGRLKNVISDSGALSVIMGLFKVMKSFNKNPEKVEEYVEAQSAGAAATPKEAPTPVEVVDSSGQPIKQVDQTDELVKSEKPFYSNVEKTISNFTFKKQPGNQILATLNNTAGIKQSEIQDLGLDSFLKDKPNVTKQELDDYIADKSLTTRVKDEILEGSEFANSKNDLFIPSDERVLKIPKQLLDANSYNDAKLIVNNDEGLYNKMLEYGKSRGLSVDDMSDEEFIEDFLKERYGITQLKPDEMVKPAKFESYVTPGGENYKEMLITAPGTPQVFTDHHYRGELAPGENLIAHARFNDRTIDGNKILFIEEIQSDLHQTGRKQGYVPKDANAPETLQQVEILREQKDNILKQIGVLKEKRAFTRTDGISMGEATKVDVIDPSTNEVIKTYKLTGNATQKANIIGEAAVYADNFNKKNGITDEIAFLRGDSDKISRQILDAKGEGKIADAPFKKNWYELTMKRLIKYAIDNGYDGIAFTSGDMQVARYPGMDNPEGLKGFYDNTLTKYTNKFANKYGVSLENKPINFTDIPYKYYSSDFELNKQYTVLDSNNDVFAKYEIVELDNQAIRGGKATVLRFTKDGKTSELYRGTSPSTAAEILADRLEGSKVPEIIDEQNSVPFLLFSPDMKNKILTEGVPIAQVEEKENKQQTSAVV